MVMATVINIANSQYVLDFIIKPALEQLPSLPNKDAAAQLMLGTAAHESANFTFIHQNKGPAVSIFQIEPNTIKALYEYNNTYKFIKSLSPPPLLITCVQFDHILAAMLCRLYYYRIPQRLPLFDDILAQAAYWKQYYNTYQGRGTTQEYITHYNAFCKGVNFNTPTLSPSPPFATV